MSGVTPAWTPALVERRTGESNADYLDRVFTHYELAFDLAGWTFDAKRVAAKRHPLRNGRPALFWHLTTTGANEDSRTIDEERCARILWPRAIMDNSDDPLVLRWTERRRGQIRVHLWVPSIKYIVVVEERKDYVLPWTAYVVEDTANRRHQLEQRYRRYR